MSGADEPDETSAEAANEPDEMSAERFARNDAARSAGSG